MTKDSSIVGARGQSLKAESGVHALSCSGPFRALNPISVAVGAQTQIEAGLCSSTILRKAATRLGDVPNRAHTLWLMMNRLT
nr:hypothetical protein [Cryobacterium sp. Hh38]